MIFAPQNFGSLKVRPAELWCLVEFWSNVTCAPLFHGDIVMGAKISIKNHPKLIFQGYFCKLLSFQRYIYIHWD